MSLLLFVAYHYYIHWESFGDMLSLPLSCYAKFIPLNILHHVLVGHPCAHAHHYRAGSIAGIGFCCFRTLICSTIALPACRCLQP
jgi:hypothetical protein